MRLPEILSMLETLDRAYETIAEEHGREAPGSPVPSWEAIVRGTPQRTGVALGDLPGADHGRTHGLSHGPLTDQLASELAGWTRLAEHSPTARSILGIDSHHSSHSERPFEEILTPDLEATSEAAEWAVRIAQRPAPTPGGLAPKPASLPERGGSPSPASTAAVATPIGIQPVSNSAVAAVAAADPGLETPMLDLPERDVTGTANRRAPMRPAPDDPNDTLLAGQRRERARVRLESTDFPCEDVEIRELSGHEAISRLFSFQVEIVCLDRDALEMEQLVGASATLVFERGAEEVRRVHGMISEVEDGLETEAEWRSFRLSIVPRLWRSTLVETQEVNLDSTVPDLVLRKLALVGLEGADVEARLLGNYPVRDLVVQYKETDLAFVSRLTEHLGICFFFDHQSGADRLVLTDANAGFQPLPGAPTLAFRPRGEASDVFEIKARSRAFPAHFAAQDYNYRTPRVDLSRVFEAKDGFGGGVIEYGSHHKTPAEGDTIARIRAEERQIASQGYVAKSDVPNVTAGGRFKLTGHERLEGREFLVVEVEHFARQTVRVHGAGSVDEAYKNTFRCVDAVLPYRPPRATPRPRIHGVLTALVEPNPDGEIGESARIDPEGRYTVKFYFDAGDPAGRKQNSRLTRMIQPHAGPGYGLHFPLKPGIEVAMIFMDGDPDRPMILGAVPNPVTPSPVVAEVNLMNRIETASGIVFEMRDAVPPIEK